MKSKLFLAILILVTTGCTEHAKIAKLPVPYRNWESNSIMSNGIRLHYWRTGGENKPVIIMAHGITDYGLNWATLASKFESEYDIIMYDERGHGFSEKPDGPYSLETHMEDLVGLINALEIDRPILIGHSMGGSIAAITAATYPNLPAAVVLEDPPMDELLERLTVDIHEDWKGMVESFNVMPKEKLMNEARTKYHPGLNMFEYDLWAESKHLAHPNVTNILREGGFGNPIEIFPKIKAPTLILKAEATKEQYKQKHLETAALLSNGNLIHIKGTSHLVRHDKPDITELEIRKFLSSL